VHLRLRSHSGKHVDRVGVYAEFINKILYSFITDNLLIGQLATWAELFCLVRSRQYAFSPRGHGSR